MMRPARPNTFHRRPVAIGLAVFTILLLLFGRASPSPYDPSKIPERPAPTDGKVIRYSIVVPAYHERENIRPLVTRVFAAAKDAASATEIVIVDDNSRDGTVEEVVQLKSDGYNVVLVVRKDGKGLSGAVLRGFEEARGTSMVVMDADLQHPPEALPNMFAALDHPSTPFALGTRYAEGVSMSKDWPMYRRIISWGARSLARPLTTASDPMSGFFGIKKEYFLKSSPINPAGFKIALELLLKSPLPSHGIADVPFSFGTRTVGESKLSSKVMFRYVGQLWSLYWYSWGLFFPILLITLAGISMVGAALAWEYLDARYALSVRGSGYAGLKKRTMKRKSEV